MPKWFMVQPIAIMIFGTLIIKGNEVYLFKTSQKESETINMRWRETEDNGSP
ncbi:hypothetical protein LguiB_033464 [Lonicera macranthoides]